MNGRRIDFLAQPAQAWWSHVLLAIGAAAVAAAAWLGQQWSLERSAPSAARDAEAMEAERLRHEISRPAPVSLDQQRLAHIAPQLRQPWLPVLRAIEAATRTPVHLLVLAIDPSSGTVRIEGEAPTFDQALEYTQALRTDDVLEGIELRSHESIVDPLGQPAVRFIAFGGWRSR